MRRTPFAVALAVVGALAFTGCASGTTGSDGADASSPAPTSSRPPFRTTTPGPVGPTGTPAPVPDAKWSAIERDLTARGVAATPELVSAEAVTFSDGSLGCATPGVSYTQALVEGMRVIVTADGRTYDYRFGAGDSPVLCTR